MPRSLLCLCAGAALGMGALGQGAAAGSGGVVLTVTARVVAACSVTASGAEAGPRFGQDCTSKVPHRVSVDSLDASSPAGVAAASTDGTWTAEPDGTDGALVVTVTY